MAEQQQDKSNIHVQINSCLPFAVVLWSGTADFVHILHGFFTDTGELFSYANEAIPQEKGR